MACCIKPWLEFAFLLKWFMSLDLRCSFYDLVQGNTDDFFFFSKIGVSRLWRLLLLCVSNFLCYIPGWLVLIAWYSLGKHLSYGNGFSCHSKGFRIKTCFKGTVTYIVLCFFSYSFTKLKVGASCMKFQCYNKKMKIYLSIFIQTGTCLCLKYLSTAISKWS